MFQALAIAILFLAIAIFIITIKLSQVVKILEIQRKIKEIEKNRETIKIKNDIYDFFEEKMEVPVDTGLKFKDLKDIINSDLKSMNTLRNSIIQEAKSKGYKLEKLEFSKLDQECDCPDCRKDNKNAKKR